MLKIENVPFHAETKTISNTLHVFFLKALLEQQLCQKNWCLSLQNSQTNLQLLLTAAVIGFHVPYGVWSFPLSSGALKNYYLTGEASFILLLLLLPRKN